MVDPDASFERIQLDATSWVDVARGWLRDPQRLYDELAAGIAWRQGRVFRYERWVDEPRLTAGWQPDRPPAVPALLTAVRALRSRYGVPFSGAGLSWYRDGRDSLAFHRDREMRWLDDTRIAILTLGARRPFHLRPRGNRWDHEAPARGATHDVAPGAGDLLVMGGRCQADWEHGVPRAPGLGEGRISVQWRWTSRTGRPVQGPGYRAPRHFTR